MDTEDRRLLRSFVIPGIMVLGLWLIHLVGWLADWDMGQWGVYPQSLPHLWGVLTAPLAHGSWGHLASNSFPLLFISAGIIYFYRQVAWPVMLTSYLAPGLWVWVAGRSSFHIGASGMVYALAFFVFFSGVFRREPRSLVLALVVAFFYGSMVWGVFPGQPHVSWESHLFGAIAGILLAGYFRKQGPPPNTYAWEHEPDEDAYDALSPWNYQSLYPPPDELTKDP
jgi:membrane associated rhomboid family serine protease